MGNNLVNILSGGAGADWIVAGPGNDTLNGDAGADALVWSNGDGTDVDEGGADIDTVVVNGNTANPDVFRSRQTGHVYASTAPTSACSASTSAPSRR